MLGGTVVSILSDERLLSNNSNTKSNPGQHADDDVPVNNRCLFDLVIPRFSSLILHVWYWLLLLVLRCVFGLHPGKKTDYDDEDEDEDDDSDFEEGDGAYVHADDAEKYLFKKSGGFKDDVQYGLTSSTSHWT